MNPAPPVTKMFISCMFSLISIDLVDADDAAVRVLVQQPPCETGADEACGSGHKYGRAVELYIFFQHLFRVYDSLRRSLYSTRLSAIVSNLKIVLPSIRKLNGR